MSTLSHRLVPIRPSPQRGVCQKGIAGINSSSPNSPISLTPPQTGIKRKYDDDDDDDDSDTESCKRRINFAMNYVCSPHPVSISRRNARERNRVKQVNNGFAALRQHIPGAGKSKKISKVDTLKQAVEYIQNLQMLLDENDRALNNSELFSPYQNSATPGSTQSSISFENINSYLSNKEGFLMPPFFYNENISPNSSSSTPNIMSPELSEVSMTQVLPNLSSCPLPLLQSPLSREYITVTPETNISTDNILSSLACTLIRSNQKPINPSNSTHNKNVPIPVTLKNSHLPFTNIHRSNVIPPPIPLNIRTSSHNSSPTLGTLKALQVSPTSLQQPQIKDPDGGDSVCTLSHEICSSLTNSVDLPVVSNEMLNPSVYHSSLPLRPPDQTSISMPRFQAATPIDLDCLSDDALSSKLPLIQANYATAFETHLDTIEESPYETSQEIGSSDSSFAIHPTCKSPPTGITNIDNVLSSNLMSSFTNLIDVYETIEQTSHNVENDLLDAIDLWEKC